MTRKMTVGAAAAAFFGTILAASATSVAGVVWNAETTNDWFTADTTSTSTWLTPSSGDVSVEGVNTIVFDTDVVDPLKYRPDVSSGPVALVNVRMVVDPNASTPSTAGLGEAQAALTVVTNDSGYLEWIGLVRDGETNKWVTLDGDHPNLGAEYDVEIALDNRASHGKMIRYSVKPPEGSYKVLTSGGQPWLANPKTNLNSVAAVGFAGVGRIKSLDGDNIVEVGPSITVNPFNNSTAYDFTNGTMTAVVTIPSGAYGNDKTAVLTISNLCTGVEHVFGPVNVTGSTVPINLGGLTAGDMYSYTVSVKYDDVERAVKAGTFVAANWPDACLFGAKFVDSSPVETNGTWQGAAIGSEKWEIVTNAQFVVDEAAKTAATLGVTRVDTSYSFETFIDTDSLEPLSGAVGGIVAVSDGANPAWYAYTGTYPLVSGGWQKLNGDIVPETNTEYVIRAEFNFNPDAHSVSYFVSTNGTAFSPLTLENNDITIGLIGGATSLSSVGMSGKGSVKSICAKLANGAVAEDSAGNKFATLWEALRNGVGDIKLNTNATLTPTGVTGGKFKFRKANGASYDVIYDGSALPGTWKFFEKDGVWYLMKPAATYIFF